MSKEKIQNILILPSWGIDKALYDRLCLFLGLTPNPTLYLKVAQYLLQVAAANPPPVGFSRRLSELRPSKIVLGFLDIWTSLLMTANPWRYRLNAIIAIHECDAQGYREMITAEDNKMLALINITWSMIVYVLYLVPGFIWLCWQGCLYFLFQNTLRHEREYFEGSTVLVTGASRGLGLAFVARLLSLGARVVAIARDSEALQSINEQVVYAGLKDRLYVVTADVSEHNAFQNALNKIGFESKDIDMAIINAGVKQEFADHDMENVIKKTFAINFFGAIQNALALLPTWTDRNKGHLIFISSLGRWHGMSRTGAYHASKAALSVLVESMIMDFRRQGAGKIQITLVEPGLIDTSMIPQKGIQKLLSVDAKVAAQHILQCAAKNKVTCRFPFLFTLITAVIAVLPLSMRLIILRAIK